MNYIKSLIDVIANQRAKNQIESYFLDSSKDIAQYHNEYEELLIQAEANVRNLIKTQHQQKLHSDSLKSKIEELEKAKNEIKKENKYIQEVINIKVGTLQANGNN